MDPTSGSSINGSWGGMIGVVSRQESDMALGSFSITHSRYQVVDFSIGFYEETKAILIPPPKVESRLFECIRPFHWQVYITQTHSEYDDDVIKSFKYKQTAIS